MTTIMRTWLGFAALGAGLIHLALVVSSPLPLSVVLAIFGTAELVWAYFILRSRRIAAPRVVLAAAIAPVAIWGVLVATAPALGVPELPRELGLGALGASSLLGIFIAIVLAAHLRRGTDFAATPRMPGTWRYLSGLLLGALAVGALTTPALASTEAGQYAQPHGEHSSEVDDEAVPTPAHHDVHGSHGSN